MNLKPGDVCWLVSIYFTNSGGMERNYNLRNKGKLVKPLNGPIKYTIESVTNINVLNKVKINGILEDGSSYLVILELGNNKVSNTLIKTNWLYEDIFDNYEEAVDFWNKLLRITQDKIKSNFEKNINF